MSLLSSLRSSHRSHFFFWMIIGLWNLFWVLPVLMAADILEIKDKGFINGEIVSEDTQKVIFKDSYGNTLEIYKADILSRQKMEIPVVKQGEAKEKSKESAGAGSKAATFIEGAKKKVNDIVENPPEQNQTKTASHSQNSVGTEEPYSYSNMKKSVTAAASAVLTNHQLIFRWLKFWSFVLGSLGFVYYFLNLIIQAFRISFFWGLLFIFVPIGTIIFLVKQWEHVHETFHKCVFFIFLALWPFLFNFFTAK